MTRLLGIDVGERRIGLAVGDTQTAVVRPLATIRRASPERDRRSIETLIAEQDIGEIVVGLPLNMDGSEGEQAAATRAWVDAVLGTIGIPLCWRDERRTSVRAEQQLQAPRRGTSGGPPSAARRSGYRAAVDRAAAALILESELDARRGGVPAA